MAMRANRRGRLLHDGAEGAGVLGFVEDGFVGGKDERGVPAYLDQVGACGDRIDGGFFDGRVMQDAAHLHVVGDDEAAEAELVAEVR